MTISVHLQDIENIMDNEGEAPGPEEEDDNETVMTELDCVGGV